MKGERLCLIANPRSAAGATGRRLGALRRAADRSFDDWDLWVTERPGHASELAARAAKDGFDVVVAVGGDGTASEVVHGLFEEGRSRNPDVIYSVIPAGTGSDLVKTLGMPTDPDAAMRIVAHHDARPVDVVRVRMHKHDGEPVERTGINVIGFGLNGEVVRRANKSSKRLGGRVTFAAATVRALAAWSPVPVVVRWVDTEGVEGSWEGRLSSAFVANGQFCGGGMWVGRGGAMDDGALDLTIIPELPWRRLVLGSPRLFTGTMDHVKTVSTRRVRSLEARAVDDAPVLIDVDGEQPGVLPVNIEAVPKALLVRGLFPYA